MTLIRPQADMTVCGEADSAAKAADRISASKPDIVIIDLSLEEGWGFDLIRSVSQDQPHVRIIILSMHDEKHYAERALRAGAHGYIMKKETAKKIIQAIRCVATGGLYLSPAMQERFARNFVKGGTGTSVSPMEHLSNRELEVFQLLGQGMSIKQAAAAIGLSFKTVHTHCSRIREKLQLGSGAELLREAIRWTDTGNR